MKYFRDLPFLLEVEVVGQRSLSAQTSGPGAGRDLADCTLKHPLTGQSHDLWNDWCQAFSLHLFYFLNTPHLYLPTCPSPFLVTVIQGNFVDLPSNHPIRSLAEEETVLPCRYQPAADVQVVQVTWYKEKPDATKEQIITAHQTNGQTGQFHCGL